MTATYGLMIGLCKFIYGLFHLIVEHKKKKNEQKHSNCC